MVLIKITLLLGVSSLLITTTANSSQWLSDIEKNTKHVEEYMVSNEQQLTSLLRGITGIEVNVYFRSNSTVIESSERQKILNVAKAMWVYPMLNVSLGGHADARGSKEYNQSLTEKRVATVKNLIESVLSNKYRAERVYTNSYGTQLASHKKNDLEGMALDRRVSILLLIQPRVYVYK